MRTPKLSLSSSSNASLKEMLLRRIEESERGEKDVGNNLLFLLRYLTIQKSMDVFGGKMRWTFGPNNISSPSSSQSHLDLSAFGNEWDDFLLDFPVESFPVPSYIGSENRKHKQFEISKEVSDSIGAQKYLSEKYLSRVRTVSSLQGKDEEVYKIHKYHSVTPTHRGTLTISCRSRFSDFIRIRGRESSHNRRRLSFDAADILCKVVQIRVYHPLCL
jgi:hypothetical protein